MKSCGSCGTFQQTKKQNGFNVCLVTSASQPTLLQLHFALIRSSFEGDRFINVIREMDYTLGDDSPERVGAPSLPVLARPSINVSMYYV